MKKNHYIDIIKSNKEISILVLGTVISQIIALLASVVLAGLYSAEEFGYYALYLSLATIIGAVIGLKYEASINSTHSENVGSNVFAISIVASTILTLLIYAILICVYVLLASRITFNKVYYIVPTSGLLMAYYQVFSIYAARVKLFKLMASCFVLQSLISAGCSILFGVWHHKNGMLYGHILGVLSVLIIFIYVMRDILTKNIVFINRRSILRTAKEYKKFPLYTLPQTAIGQICSQFPTFALQVLYGSSVVGNYYLAYRVVVAPLTILSGNMAKVFNSGVAKRMHENPENLYISIKASMLRLFIAAGACSVLIWIAAPNVFSIVWGPEWQQAGEIAQILLFYLVLDFAVTPFMSIYLVSGLNHLYLLWDVARLSLLFALYLFAKNLKIMSATYFTIQACIYGVLLMILAIGILYRKSWIWTRKSLTL